MDILLRDPAEKNPPSLLQGDNVLYSQPAAGIRDFHDALYNSSWRAFDWMWGRLDGCGELRTPWGARRANPYRRARDSSRARDSPRARATRTRARCSR